MKKLLTTFGIIILFAGFSNAQLKIFTGGNMTIGNVNSPLSGFKLHVQGNTVFSYDSNSIASAALIRGLNAF